MYTPERNSPLGTVVLECVVGSTLYGANVQDGLEDLDLMAVAIEDMPQAMGFGPKDTHVFRTKPDGVRSEAGDIDRVTYGLRKYLHLALKGNPSTLALLFVPPNKRTIDTAVGAGIQALAPYIVSAQAKPAFQGYVTQQHERLLGLRGQRNVTRPELVARYGYDTKYAMHIVRLAHQGIELLTTGQMTFPSPIAEELRAIRLGKYPLADMSRLITESERALDACTPLVQPAPQTAVVEAWMLQTYREWWKVYSFHRLIRDGE